jgi:hypothetical protein
VSGTSREKIVEVVTVEAEVAAGLREEMEEIEVVATVVADAINVIE